MERQSKGKRVIFSMTTLNKKLVFLNKMRTMGGLDIYG